MSTRLRASDVLLVRYGELALKGANRPDFEARLCKNLAAATRDLANCEIERRRGRIVVKPHARSNDVARRLTEVFGITSISPAWTCASERDAIASLALLVLDDARADVASHAPLRFRVRVKRADKTFAESSEELERGLGARLLAQSTALAVDLHAPDVTLEVDVRAEATYVLARRFEGPGGLPVGALGRALCLLSGGIDSPVAAWMAMKRGLELGFVHFHSAAYVGDASRRKVEGLARSLARWQPTTRLAIVPFARVQEAIRDRAPSAYRTLLYRRAMLRIAERLAPRAKAAALVTGDNLGQVASQTLENLRCADEAVAMPVLRPLLAFDKQDTIALARRIGTFELSNVDAVDCCSLFAEGKPIVHGSPEACARIEAETDVETELATAVDAVEVSAIAC